MISFLFQSVRIGMALLFGSTGETLTEKAGHLNLGIPGVMCVGAACGCVTASKMIETFGDVYEKGFFLSLLTVVLCILATIAGGAIMGLIYSFLTVTLRANQNVTGLAMTTFGVGVSDVMIANVNSFSLASKCFTAHLPFADKLGGFGKLFLSYGVLVYIAIAVAIAVSLVLKRTKLGLHLRAVGENPATADAAGINVTAYRYGATCVGCAIAGLGGFTYIIDYLGGNWEYVIDAMGWLAVALVIFTIWNPEIGILGSIAFGALYIASSYVTGISLSTKEFFKMLPYVVTIIVLVITSIRNKRENQPPASLGLNYFREER
ncbi:MAG: ABC transporter permease [Eubacteriales bacterium]